jgi:hypothetical protein
VAAGRARGPHAAASWRRATCAPWPPAARPWTTSRRILAGRAAFYSKADFSVDTERRQPAGELRRTASDRCAKPCSFPQENCRKVHDSA